MEATEKLRDIVNRAVDAGKATRYQIAKDAGIQYSSLSRWLDRISRREGGEESEIRSGMIDKLAKFFQVTFTDPPKDWEPIAEPASQKPTKRLRKKS